MQAALLKELAGRFSDNRMLVAREIREMRENDPAGFASAAVEILRDSPVDSGARFLLALLLTQPGGLALICDPLRFTPEQSIALVREAKTLDSQVEVKLARMLSATPLLNEDQINLAARIMDILNHSSDPMTILPALRQLLQCNNARVRSKAALLIGRFSRNPQWAKLSDPAQDQRVVANAIESLWGLDSPAAKAAFREAAGDPRNRVAGNGAIGLYIAGDQHGVVTLFRLSRSKDATFRATAAWSMGRSGDPRFLNRLEELLSDPSELVRRSAGKAKARVSERVTKLRANPPLKIQIRTAKWHAGEHDIHLMIGDGGASTRGLYPLQFVLRSGTEIVEEFAFAEIPGSSPLLYQVKWNGPISGERQVKVDFYTAEATGSDTGLELAF